MTKRMRNLTPCEIPHPEQYRRLSRIIFDCADDDTAEA